MSDPITVTFTITGIDPDRWLASALKATDAPAGAEPPIFVRPPTPTPPVNVHHADGNVGGICNVAGCDRCPQDRRMLPSRNMAITASVWRDTILAHGESDGPSLRAIAESAALLCDAGRADAVFGMLAAAYPGLHRKLRPLARAAVADVMSE